MVSLVIKKKTLRKQTYSIPYPAHWQEGIDGIKGRGISVMELMHVCVREVKKQVSCSSGGRLDFSLFRFMQVKSKKKKKKKFRSTRRFQILIFFGLFG